jgi:hypothetical protein
MAEFEVLVASREHIKYAEEISILIKESASERGTGIAVRSVDYISEKMSDGKAVIALEKGTGTFAGFCYIESWGNKKFAANSGLIISRQFRRMGLAMKVKEKAFQLSRERYPNAKLFGLTTSLAVMKINSDLGYRPVTFSELTDDEDFWGGCKSCVNYDVLTRTHKKHCLCTGMLYDPNEKNKHQRKKFKDYKDKYRKWLSDRKEFLLKRFKKEIVSILY